ncbi:MAG: SurA N-terminal domain-containing protein [Pseudomonadota bacterium]
MLQDIREKFTGTFAIVLLAMIGLSFVFFGLNYSFIGSTYAAKVDGEQINPAEFEQRFGQAVQSNPQLATLEGPLRAQIRRQLLDQLIVEQLIENYLDEHGYRISDEQVMASIREEPQFSRDGRFDLETYRTFLAERGIDPTLFEESQRQRLRQQQLQLAIAATALVTPAEYRRYLNLFAEQRVVTVASIAAADVDDAVEIDEQAVLDYYESNAPLYELPDSADIEFIELKRSDVAGDIAVSEATLQSYYEDNSRRYLQDEQRRARHILILKGDDEAAAEAEASDILARIRAGESFEDLAAELSADSLTATQGGDFGPLTRDQYQVELASEIFSMAEGDLAGPVQSEFGFHVLRLDEILEPGPLPLEEVRSELLAELREDEADVRYRELERSLSDALFDLTDMQAIADATGLELQTAAGITRTGGEAVGSNQAALDAIFDELVLTGGQISELVELDADTTAIFKVTSYREAALQPLDAVRDEVEAALRAQRADQIMQERAEALLTAVDSGTPFADAAAEASLSVAEPQLVGRGDNTLDPSLSSAVFAARKPSAGDPVTGRVRLADGSYSVYSVDAVLPGRPETIPLAQRDQGKLQLAQQSGFGDLQAFVKSLYDNADIVVNDDIVAGSDLF